MAGKMLDGSNNPGRDLRTIRAYAEGVAARQADTDPTNPHTSGMPEYTAWAQGVTDCAAEDGSTEDCVANPDGAAAT